MSRNSIIEDLGGILEPNDDNNNNINNNKNYRPSLPGEAKIDIYPPTYNRIPRDENKTWTIYLQFDDDTPIPFAFVPNGDEMRIRFFEPNHLKIGEKSPALVFTDTNSNKKLRLFAKK